MDPNIIDFFAWVLKSFGVLSMELDDTFPDTGFGPSDILYAMSDYESNADVYERSSVIAEYIKSLNPSKFVDASWPPFKVYTQLVHGRRTRIPAKVVYSIEDHIDRPVILKILENWYDHPDIDISTVCTITVHSGMEEVLDGVIAGMGTYSIFVYLWDTFKSDISMECARLMTEYIVCCMSIGRDDWVNEDYIYFVIETIYEWSGEYIESVTIFHQFFRVFVLLDHTHIHFPRFIAYVIDTLMDLPCSHCVLNRKCCVVKKGGKCCMSRPIDAMVGPDFNMYHTSPLYNIPPIFDTFTVAMNVRKFKSVYQSRKFICVESKAYPEHMCKTHNSGIYDDRGITMKVYGSPICTYKYTNLSDWRRGTLGKRSIEHIPDDPNTLLFNCKLIEGGGKSFLRIPRNGSYPIATTKIVELHDIITPPVIR